MKPLLILILLLCSGCDIREVSGVCIEEQHIPKVGDNSVLFGKVIEVKIYGKEKGARQLWNAPIEASSYVTPGTEDYEYTYYTYKTFRWFWEAQ